MTVILRKDLSQELFHDPQESFRKGYTLLGGRSTDKLWQWIRDIAITQPQPRTPFGNQFRIYLR